MICCHPGCCHLRPTCQHPDTRGTRCARPQWLIAVGARGVRCGIGMHRITHDMKREVSRDSECQSTGWARERLQCGIGCLPTLTHPQSPDASPPGHPRLPLVSTNGIYFLGLLLDWTQMINFGARRICDVQGRGVRRRCRVSYSLPSIVHPSHTTTAVGGRVKWGPEG